MKHDFNKSLLDAWPISLPLLFIIVPLNHYWLTERRLRCQLLPQGRYIGSQRLITQLRGGTIIVDHAAFNHTRLRIWWTPENIMALSPFPFTNNSNGNASETYKWPAFDRWIHERFLDPASGTARLLKSTLKRWTPERIAAMYPGIAITTTFSARGIIEKRFQKQASINPPVT